MSVASYVCSSSCESLTETSSLFELSLNARPGKWQPRRPPMPEIDDGRDRYCRSLEGEEELKKKRPHLKARFVGKAFKPCSDDRCMACDEPGHHVGNCVKAIRDRAGSVAVDCVEGRHFPYLHGVWRCQYCHMHLYDADVKRQMPKYHKKEVDREWEKMQRYGAPNFVW